MARLRSPRWGRPSARTIATSGTLSVPRCGSTTPACRSTISSPWIDNPIQRDEQESVASLDVLPGYAFTPDSKAIVISYGGKIWRVPVDGSAATNIPFHVHTRLDVGPKLAFSYPIADSAEFTMHQIR